MVEASHHYPGHHRDDICKLEELQIAQPVKKLDYRISIVEASWTVLGRTKEILSVSNRGSNQLSEACLTDFFRVLLDEVKKTLLESF